ncbi:MAG TPA: hydantoinase/carbamoylase family amidase [Baekduia sp.]|uniref:hydantoinase/carbamoylase family amidase n=1 Tax=Baekduia sp. TaxID=2600305 RepID=UPI002CF9F1C0|nr:hydantoinase/carbamoylase family amidase [Baekduia sp.]HMJ36745.1 hydantoinase/carbamoylase family amidase [Baekduia sp.]
MSAAAAITAADLEARLSGLRSIGLSAAGTNRLAWTPEDAAAGAWFSAQAAGLGLIVSRDAAGNRWAVPDRPGPWWAVGSHTDSVRDGGAYDGALGVAAAFAIAAAARVPLAVVSFADEEGARFNTPTFGSRALAGTLDVEDVLRRRDDDGVLLAAALRDAGIDPDGLAAAPPALGDLRGFVELHIDQSRDVAGEGAPAGIVTALASRLRARVTFDGASDHAGTTPPEDRRDALAAAARLVVAADELRAAVDADPPMRSTAGRILVAPNALTSIPAHVTVWLDARAADPAALDAWLAAVNARATELAAGTGVAIAVTVESRGAGVTFDGDLRARLRAAAGDAPCPDVLCWAGHDAGVLAPRLPAAMVLVRNPTGVSHAAAEHVDLGDAAAAATLILSTLEGLV